MGGDAAGVVVPIQLGEEQYQPAADHQGRGPTAVGQRLQSFLSSLGAGNIGHQETLA